MFWRRVGVWQRQPEARYLLTQTCVHVCKRSDALGWTCSSLRFKHTCFLIYKPHQPADICASFNTFSFSEISDCFTSRILLQERHVSYSCPIWTDGVYCRMNDWTNRRHNASYQHSFLGSLIGFRRCFSTVTAVQTQTLMRLCALWCASRKPSANAEGWWISAGIHTQTLSCLISQSGRLWKHGTDCLQPSSLLTEVKKRNPANGKVYKGPYHSWSSDLRSNARSRHTCSSVMYLTLIFMSARQQGLHCKKRRGYSNDVKGRKA